MMLSRESVIIFVFSLFLLTFLLLLLVYLRGSEEGWECVCMCVYVCGCDCFAECVWGAGREGARANMKEKTESDSETD